MPPETSTTNILVPPLENAMPVGKVSCPETPKESTDVLVEASNGVDRSYSCTLSLSEPTMNILVPPLENAMVQCALVAVYHDKRMKAYYTRLAKRHRHGILLQGAVTIPGATFSNAYTRALRKMGDYRIDESLKIIDCINDILARVGAKISAAVDGDPDARLLMTIPGVGEYTALAMSSAIDGAGRFADSHSLVAYFGLAPTVRNSADKVHHGRITEKGDKLARHVLVEAAHNHARFAPHSKLTQFYRRVQAKKGTSKAAVATASKLVRIMYQILKNGRKL